MIEPYPIEPYLSTLNPKLYGTREGRRGSGVKGR